MDKVNGGTERPPGRSMLLGALAPEAVAAGYDPGDGRWVTVSEATSAGAATFAPLPPLSGVVVTAGAAREAVAGDFGNLLRGVPSAVLRPGSPDDVAAVVRFAREHGLRVAARGQGHAAFGQGQVEGGIQVDMRPLSSVGTVSGDGIDVEAGASWATVLRAALARHLMPLVIPDYIDLSVGGTLAVGGIGYTSWRHGALVDNVTELTVVTGTGEIACCSPRQQPDLFEAVLAGLGQCALIMRARLSLVAAPRRVRVFDLPYPDLATMEADLCVLVGDGRFDALVGLIVPGPGGWLHLLEAASFLGPEGGPPDERLLDGLSFLPGTQQVFEQPFFQFANRVTVQMGDLAAVGLLDAAHPWLTLFVPATAVHEFVGDVLSTLTVADVGRSFPLLLHPLTRAPLTRPLLRTPDDETFMGFSVLRAATPGAITAAEMLEDNRRLFEANRAMGGRNYPIGAVALSPEDWQRHFDPHWERFADAKRRFDPDGVLTPGPGIW